MKRILALACLVSTLNGPSYLQAQNKLAEIAASMQPGTFALLNQDGDGSGYGKNLLWTGGSNGITGYASKAVYDAATDRIYFSGGEHGGSTKTIYYEIAANRWVDLGGIGAGRYGHAYDSNAIVPGTHELYANSTLEANFRRLDLTTNTWSIPPQPPYLYRTEPSVEYFPERDELLWLQGGWFGGLAAYKRYSDTWNVVTRGLSELQLRGAIARYMPGQHAVLLMGGVDSSPVYPKPDIASHAMYRYDENGVITRLQDFPSSIWMFPNMALAVVDPVTSELIVINTVLNGSYMYESGNPNPFTGAIEIWRYNMADDTWTQMDSSIVPNINEWWLPTDATNNSGAFPFAVVTVPVPQYGVVLFASAVWGFPGRQSRVYVYKHSAASGIPYVRDTTEPSVPAGLTATAVSSSQIDLSWTPATDDTRVAGYRIFRDGTQVGTAAGTNYQSNGLLPATSYTFTVSAYDVAGNHSSESDPATAATLAASAAGNLFAGLVGYWNFDEGAGTVAEDSSGSGNTGVLMNGPSWTAGYIGGALSFDGIDDYVTVANTPSLNPQTVTLSAWININDNTVDQRIIDRGLDGATYFLGLLGNPNNLVMRVGPVRVVGKSAVSPGVWHHVAGTYDGSNLTVYLDGVVDDSVSVSSGLLIDNRVPLTIGRRAGGGFHLGGVIDDARIYNRALSPPDVEALFMLSGTIPVDTMPPSAVITSPASGSTVSGTITVSADAFDDIAIARVQFRLDDVNLGAEIAAPPYSLSWNTIRWANGGHVLTVAVRDAAGNETVSAPVYIEIFNDPDAVSSGSAFAQKCAQPGVLGCYGFDSASNVRDFPSADAYPLKYGWADTPCDSAGLGTNSPLTRSRSNDEATAIAAGQNGVCYYPQVDNATFFSGAGSLRIEVPSNSDSRVGGYFDTTFQGLDLPHVRVGPDNGGEIWHQYRYRTQNIVTNSFNGAFPSSAIKTIIFGSVPPGLDYLGSDYTLVSTFIVSAGWPGNRNGLYQSYTRNAQGNLDVSERNINGTIYLQTGSMCAYNGAGPYSYPPCVRQEDDRWIEITRRLKIQPVATNFSVSGTTLSRSGIFNSGMVGRYIYIAGDGYYRITAVIDSNSVTLNTAPAAGTNKTVYISDYPNSVLQEWADGVLVVNNSNQRMTWDMSNAGWGEFRLQPHMTSKDPSIAHTPGTVWYDDFIVSTEPIEMTAPPAQP